MLWIFSSIFSCDPLLRVARETLNFTLVFLTNVRCLTSQERVREILRKKTFHQKFHLARAPRREESRVRPKTGSLEEILTLARFNTQKSSSLLSTNVQSRRGRWWWYLNKVLSGLFWSEILRFDCTASLADRTHDTGNHQDHQHDLARRNLTLTKHHTEIDCSFPARLSANSRQT